MASALRDEFEQQQIRCLLLRCTDLETVSLSLAPTIAIVKGAFSCLRWQNTTELAKVLGTQATLVRGGLKDQKLFFGNLQRKL